MKTPPTPATPVDRATLAPVVRAALGDQDAELGSWEHEPLHGGVGALGVFRLRGTAHVGGADRPWSAILKVLGPGSWPGDDDPARREYWRREVLVYDAGFLDDLPAGLSAPRRLGVQDRPDGTVLLWLEDIGRDDAGPWSLDRYALAARRLGAFNGAYLAGRPLPSAPWLNSAAQWRQTVDAAGALLPQLEPLEERPRVRQYWSPDMPERVRRLRADRESFLDASTRLPRTFCHHDAFRRNLLTRRAAEGREEIVAIDWNCCGIGAVGEEMRGLVIWSSLFFEVDAGRLEELDRLAFEGYVWGLRDAGWEGDARLARLGYVIIAALVAISPFILVEPDERFRALVERAFGRAFNEHMVHATELHRYALDRADEARALLAVV